MMNFHSIFYGSLFLFLGLHSMGLQAQPAQEKYEAGKDAYYAGDYHKATTSTTTKLSLSVDGVVELSR